MIKVKQLTLNQRLGSQTTGTDRRCSYVLQAVAQVCLNNKKMFNGNYKLEAPIK